MSDSTHDLGETIDPPIESADSADSGPSLPLRINIRSAALTGILLLLVLHAMYMAASLLIPIALGFLLSVVLSPIVRGMVRLRVPQVVAALLVMLGLAAGLFAGVYSVIQPALDWVERAPEELEALERKLSWVEEPARKLKEAQEQVAERVGVENAGADPQTSFSLFGTVLEGAPDVIFGTAITLILLFFALASGDSLLNKAVQVAPSLTDKKRVVEAGRDIQRHVSTYLGTITIINIVVGVLVATAMWLLEMPSPILWGAMVAVLNYIPYLGVGISIVVVTFVAMLTFDAPVDMFLPGIAIFLINVVEGQFITPILAGRTLSLSPVAVFLSLVVMGWLWGIIGVLMAVPLLAIVRLVCEQVEPLEFVATFLGADQTHSR